MLPTFRAGCDGTCDEVHGQVPGGELGPRAERPQQAAGAHRGHALGG